MILLLAALLLAALPNHYHVTISANYANVGVEMLIECKDTHYLRGIYADVDGINDQLTVDLEKPVDLPKGRCTGIVSVLRNDEYFKGDPKDDYIGESIIVTLQH